MFWLFARAFRRGLTPWLAAALGLAMVAAPLVQIRGLGLAPGWAVGVLALLWLRSAPGTRLRNALAVALPAAIPLVLYEVVNVLIWDRPLIPGGVSAAAGAGAPAGRDVTGFPTFVWQYFFPKLGGMTDFFGVTWTVQDLWVPMWAASSAGTTTSSRPSPTGSRCWRTW